MVSVNEDPSNGHSRGVERRTILKAAAWTVPTIVVATASPAAANASGTMAAVSASGTVVGLANVRFTVTFAGSSPGPHTVTFSSVHIPSSITVNINATRSIPPGGGSVQFVVVALALNLNLHGKTAMITYSVQGHGSGTISAAIA